MILEHPKVPIQPHIHTGRLHHPLIKRINNDPPRSDLRPNIPIRKQHLSNLPTSRHPHLPIPSPHPPKDPLQ
ncbi:hypothetical protein GCM10009677_27710 [Sphaerisporangium rubeum]